MVHAGMAPVEVGTERVRVHWSDCLTHLRSMPDNSVHAVITDPPYGLSNHSAELITKAMMAWASGDRERVPDPKGGFMGRQWDSFVPPPAVWDEAYRVLRPGGHLAVFCGSRTVDIMGLSIRLAGFEMRDTIGAWLYGSGFPKSLDVGKAIDATTLHGGSNSARIKAANASRPGEARIRTSPTRNNGVMGDGRAAGKLTNDNPATDAARAWQGWGTALKPAFEPILLARKPLSGTVAATVLAHGTGAVHVDTCRVGDGADRSSGGIRQGPMPQPMSWGEEGRERTERASGGRWPTNVVLAHHPDCGSDEAPTPCVPGCHVAALDEQSGTRRSAGNYPSDADTHGMFHATQGQLYADSGGASRFFPTFRYQAKAGKRERPKAWGRHPDCRCAISRPFDPETGALPPRHRVAGFEIVEGKRKAYGTECATCGRRATFRGHPTVKPQGLIGWLVDLLVAPGGVVADLFSGSGSLGGAVEARDDGTTAVLCEMDEHSVRLIATRLGAPHDFRSAPLLADTPQSIIDGISESLPESESEPEPEPLDADPMECPSPPRRRHARTPKPAPPAPPAPVVDDTPAGRVAACMTIAELTALHAALRTDPDIEESELWTLVQARWDEISAAARPEAKRARVHRPKRPSWAG